MNVNILLPFVVFFPFVAGVISYLIGRRNKKARNVFAGVCTAVVFACCLFMINKDAVFEIPYFCGLGIGFVGDGLRVVLACLASFIWMMTTIFSDEYFAHYRNRNRYYFYMLLTLGATLGVFLSKDLFTTFIFFEIMSFTSYVLVIHEESDTAFKAAGTYLAVAVIGGLVTLMGLFMLYHVCGTLQINELVNAVSAAKNPTMFYIIGVLVLFGFGAKAGMFPMHIWLPEAHPVAPAPASALLSCILTKSGVYGIIVLSCVIFLHDPNWGMLILILGTITMVLGAVLAVFSINFKRTLACSSLSQIGFILVAIGMQCLLGEHNALAAAGTILHITNHALLKLCLFTSAGVIYMNLHELDLNKIRGFGKNKWLLKVIFLMGCLGIMGIPGWNGYISKTLIHESIVEYIAELAAHGESVVFFKAIEYLFLFAGGLTIAYMSKLFVAVFMEENINQKKMEKKTYMNKATTILLSVSAFILPIMGLFPHQIMDTVSAYAVGSMNAHVAEHAVAYFSWVNLKGAVISIVIGAVVYFGFIRVCLMKKENGRKVYVDVWPAWLSIENMIYRPLLLKVLPFIGAVIARVIGSITDGVINLSKILVFNQDNGKVVPKESDSLLIASLDSDKTTRVSLSKSLLFFALGVVLILLYILI